MKFTLLMLALSIVVLGGFILWMKIGQFPSPKGGTAVSGPIGTGPSAETGPPGNMPKNDAPAATTSRASGPVRPTGTPPEDGVEKLTRSGSGKKIEVTDGTKHSIPLDEIQSGGPGKDGIPSIDDPKFITPAEAGKWLSGEDAGLGLSINGDDRFYPYQILVWHEITNDVVGGRNIAVTYCPLCGTGIAFDRNVNGETLEFGVSGMLWQSNLLMYDRNKDPNMESLWSQILGEAVLGPKTGTVLDIVRSDTALFAEWLSAHPNTKVLSRDTNAKRDYGRDPYGDYYTNNDVLFGASFSDNRLHPKTKIFGIEINGMYKAYAEKDLPKDGSITDSFAGSSILLETNGAGGIRIHAVKDKKEILIPHVEGFWFSWLAVHPDTELFNKKNNN